MARRRRPRVARRECPDCAAQWRATDARWCGNCGAALTAMVAPAAAGTRRRGHASARRLAVGVGLSLTVVAATSALPGAEAPDIATLPTGHTEASQVALPDADDDAAPLALGTVGGEQAQRLRGQIDPATPRCEPRGCERWRVDLADPSVTSGADGDVVAYLDEQEVVALDAFDGTELLREPATSLLPTGGQEAAPVEDGRILVVDGTIVLAGSAGVGAIGLDGERVFTAAGQPANRVWGIAVVDGDILVQAGRPATPSVQRIDLETGMAVWIRYGVRIQGVLDDEVVLRADPDPGDATAATDAGTGREPSTIPPDSWRIVVVDADTGRALWREDVASQRWTFTFGEVMLMMRPPGEGDVVVDARTGEVVTDLGGSIRGLHPGLPRVSAMQGDLGGMDETIVVLEEPGVNDPRGRSTSVVSVDRTGTLRWRTPVPTTLPQGWYPEIHAGERGELWIAVAPQRTVSLDRRSGRLLDADAADRGSGHANVTWRTHDGGSLHLRDDAMTYRGSAGELSVQGEGLWLLSDGPLVVQGRGALIGVEPATPG